MILKVPLYSEIQYFCSSKVFSGFELILPMQMAYWISNLKGILFLLGFSLNNSRILIVLWFVHVSSEVGVAHSNNILGVDPFYFLGRCLGDFAV